MENGEWIWRWDMSWVTDGDRVGEMVRTIEIGIPCAAVHRCERLAGLMGGGYQYRGAGVGWRSRTC